MTFMKVLQVTWSNPATDGRVLKSLSVAASYGNEVRAIGVTGVDAMSAVNSSKTENFEIAAWQLFARSAHFLPTALRQFLTWLEFTLRLFVYCLVNRFDVIHVHDYQPIPAIWLLRRVKKFKLIYEAHELESEASGLTKAQSLVIFFLEKLVWSDIDHFITVSQSILNWYESALGVKKASVILNSPMDHVVVKADTYREEFESIRRDGGYSIIYVGLFRSGRGLERIVEIFKNLNPKFNLFLIGKGPLEERLQSIASGAKNVKFLSPVSHSEIVPVLRSADIGLCLIENVSLSDYYALPNKLFEYIFAELPIVASDFPEIRRLYQNVGKFGRLVDPYDAEQIRSAIIEISECLSSSSVVSTEFLKPYLGSEQYKALKLIYGSGADR